MPEPPERWMLILEPLPDDTRPAGVRVRQLLKLAKRTCGLKCVRVRDAVADEQFILALAERVYEQSELLSRRAERKPCGGESC